jgi:hypothetical protein
VWDAATGQAIGAPLRHEEPVYSAAFSPDGRRVVTASEDQTAQVWDAATGQAIGTPLRHEGWVTTAAFSPDGRRVVTASEDQTAQVWDAATGQAIGAPLRHEERVYTAAFSPDGRRVVTASGDQTAQVWDAATGQAIGAPLRHEERVYTAGFSPDGRRVVTASEDRTARVWDVLFGSPEAASLLAEIAEAVGGYEVTDLGTPALLQARNQKLLKVRESAKRGQHGDGTAAALMHWFFRDPWKRTISPLSEITVPEYIQQLLDQGTDDARREAERAFPGHPLLSEPDREQE